MIDTIHYRRHRALAQAVPDMDSVRSSVRRTVDYDTTAFVYYPDPRRVHNTPEYYNRIRTFARYNKVGQRNVLSEYFDMPRRYPDGEFPYVVRPLNHFGGREFHVVDNEADLQDVRNGLDGSYAVELFRRDKEFRHLFIGGEHIVTLYKDRPEGVAQEEPWNHAQAGTTFMTVTRDVNDKLLETDFYESAERFFRDYPLDVVAFDTAYRYRDNAYRLFEVNLAPQVTIPHVLESIRDRLREMRWH